MDFAVVSGLQKHIATGERIIIKSGILFRSLIPSLNLESISDIEYTKDENRSRTVQFHSKMLGIRWNAGMGWLSGTKE